MYTLTFAISRFEVDGLFVNDIVISGLSGTLSDYYFHFRNL